MKTNRAIMLLLPLLGCLFFACGPTIKLVDVKKIYWVTPDSVPVVRYESPKDIPENYEKLGRLYIYTTTLSSDSANKRGDEEIRKYGGNALLVKHRREVNGSTASSFHLKGDVLHVNDFTSPRDSLKRSLKNKKKPVVAPAPGDWHFRFSLPYVNNFYLQRQSGTRVYDTGYAGIQTGLDYYHQANQYLSLLFGVGADSEYLIPVAHINSEGIEEIIKSVYLTLSNNHQIKRWSLGYGLSFSRNEWTRNYYPLFNTENVPHLNVPQRSLTYTGGLFLSSYYAFTPTFHIGMMYRPSFYQFNTQRFAYEHTISLDFVWKIRLYSAKAPKIIEY